MLTQAENDDDEPFWEEKFYLANGNTQACTQGALLCFLLSLGGGGSGEGCFFIFPWFPMCSHYVPKILPLPLAQAKHGDQ
jgi:hypothetical protein